MLCIGAAQAQQPIDTGFLKEEPFRKAKQAVDLSGIGSADEIAVVRDAIDPVMRFLVALMYTRLPAAVSRELMTEHGRAVLRRPPVRNANNRYALQRVGNWRVCGADTLVFDATYADLLRRDRWEAGFLFKKIDGAWRFHAHRDANTSEPAHCISQ